MQRGIDCGALVDPWNILGFQGQYPRFQALEDSVRDHRINHLIAVVTGIFDLYARVLNEGAARESFAQAAGLKKSMRRLAEWWDRFATTTVSDVPHVHGAIPRDAVVRVWELDHLARAIADGTAPDDL